MATLDHFDQDKKRTVEALGISLEALFDPLGEYGKGRSASALPSLSAPPQPRETAGRLSS